MVKTQEKSDFQPIREVLKIIHKKHPNANVDLVSDCTKQLEVIRTGSLYLDERIPYGGFPKGKITHLWGPQRSFKTTLAMTAALNAVREDDNYVCVYLDFEKTFGYTDSLNYLRHIGWNDEDLEKFILIQEVPENAFDIIENLLSTIPHQIPIIIIDSVSAMVPERVFEKTYAENQKMALKATFVSDMISRINSKNVNSAIVLINQARAVFDAYSKQPYTYSAPYQLKHLTSLSLRCVGKVPLQDNVKIDGITKSEVHVKVEKCKIGGENREIRLSYQQYPNGRFDEKHDYLMLLPQLPPEIYERRGSFIYIKNPENGELMLKVQGENQFIEAMNDPSCEPAFQLIKDAINAKIEGRDLSICVVDDVNKDEIEDDGFIDEESDFLT